MSHKNATALPAERRAELRAWMERNGFGFERNIMVWYFLDGHGWDLVPVEFMLDRLHKEMRE